MATRWKDTAVTVWILAIGMLTATTPKAAGQLGFGDIFGGGDAGCTSSEQCASGQGFSRCNVTSGHCDCTFAQYQYGKLCDKVCTENAHCVHGTCCYDSGFLSECFQGVCTCEAGYSVDAVSGLCTQALCASECLNGGVCTSPNQCQCLPGYTGTQCQTKLACSPLANPAKGRTFSMMQNGIQFQTFECNDGYVLNGSSSAICRDTKWSPPSLPTCVDLDECATNQHLCARQCGACDNTIGGYRCIVAAKDANKVFDATKGRCCTAGEPCTTTCFPHINLQYGTLEYDPPLSSDAAQPLALTIVRVACDASQNLVLPSSGTLSATCTKSGLWSGQLSDCTQRTRQNSSTSVPGVADGGGGVGGGDGGVGGGDGDGLFTDQPPTISLDEEAKGAERRSSDTALIASLVTVTIVIIIIVLGFLHFRSRKPEHHYAKQPTESPPPSAGIAMTTSDGRGPPMHTQLPAALTAANVPTSARPSRGQLLSRHGILEDETVYASPQTVIEPSALKTQVSSLGLAHLASDENIVDSQHYASCDLQPDGIHMEDVYDDACSMSPNKAATLPSSLPAKPSFLGSSDSSALPQFSHQVSNPTTSALSAAAAMATSARLKKSRAAALKVHVPPSGHQQAAPPAIAQRPAPRPIHKPEALRQPAALASDSEYENPSSPTSAPSSPPFQLNGKSTRAALIQSFHTHAQHSTMRPSSTSPTAQLTSTGSNSTTPTPPDSASPTGSLKRKVDKPKRPAHAPPTAPDRLSSKAAKPLHQPPVVPDVVSSQVSATSAEQSQFQWSATSSSTSTPRAESPETDAALLTNPPPNYNQVVGIATGKPALPHLPSKANRPKLDDTPAEPLNQKPSRAPKQRPAAMTPSASFEAEDGYLSPTEEVDATLDTGVVSGKPAPPPKKGRPSLTPNTAQDEESKPASGKPPPPRKPVPEKPSDSGKPDRPERPAVAATLKAPTSSSSLSLTATSLVTPSVTSAPGRQHIPPPRTASMPRFPSSSLPKSSSSDGTDM